MKYYLFSIRWSDEMFPPYYVVHTGKVPEYVAKQMVGKQAWELGHRIVDTRYVESGFFERIHFMETPLAVR